MHQINAGTGMTAVKFSDVRDAVPLTWFFENMLKAKPKQMAGTIRYSVCPHPSCGASSDHSVKVSVRDDRWMCWACGNTGDVVEAAAAHLGVSLREAGMQLLGADREVMKAYVPPKPLPVVNRDDSALGMVISALAAEANKPDAEMVAYLNGRGISTSVIREAIKRKLMVVLSSNPQKAKDFLYGLVGEDLLIKAGMLKEGRKAPAIAFRPLIFIAQGGASAEFRITRKPKPDEVKSLRYGSVTPWAWQGESSDRILITEGCIDLLAAVQMGTKRSIIGLPGCENWSPEWFSKLKGRNVLTALDNDGPGQAGTEKLIAVLKAVGAQVAPFPVPKGVCDLDDMLIAVLKRIGVQIGAQEIPYPLPKGACSF